MSEAIIESVAMWETVCDECGQGQYEGDTIYRDGERVICFRCHYAELARQREQEKIADIARRVRTLTKGQAIELHVALITPERECGFVQYFNERQANAYETGYAIGHDYGLKENAG